MAASSRRRADAVTLLAILAMCALAGAVMWYAVQQVPTDGIRTVTQVRDAKPPLDAFEAVYASLAVGMIAAHYIVRLTLDERRERRKARHAAAR